MLEVVALVALLLAIGPGPVAAQEAVPPPMAPDAGLSLTVGGDEAYGEGFGTDDLDICTLGFADLQPLASSVEYTTTTGTTGERWATSGSSYLVAPLDCVPNGALIRQVGVYGRDTSSTANFEGRLVVYYRESNLGTTNGGVTIDSCSSTSSPGLTACFFEPNHTVMRRGLWDGDGLQDVANYQIWVQTPTSDVGGTRIAEIRIMWRRQISPEPATATFADVPVGAFGFQHVEALVDSGITAGCGGGNFCPNAPLTRVQMAIFLSKALGLHWPSGLSF
jgi:hypothetical protein